MFKVKKQCCKQCLFGKNKIVDDERKDSILENCKINDSHFICHEATINKEDVCCKGFYDTQNSSMMRVSSRLNMVEFVD